MARIGLRIHLLRCPICRGHASHSVNDLSAQSEPAFVNSQFSNEQEMCQAQKRPASEHQGVRCPSVVASKPDSRVDNLQRRKDNDRSARLRCAPIQHVMEMIASGFER